MLDMGFEIQIDEVVKRMTKNRQTLMFSATIPRNISKLAEKYLIEPKRITIGSENEVPKNLKQETTTLPYIREQSQKIEESILPFPITG